MATVCVGCGLDVDEDGKLIVLVAPGTACSPNGLECTAAGMQVKQKRKHLRRTFTAAGSLSIASDVGPSVSRDMNLYGTVDDNGSAAGLWTIQGDGSILINCAGVYHVTQQTIVEGSTGQVVGGRARVVEGAGTAAIIASHEFNDYNSAVDLAFPNDGPEFNAANIRYLQVNDVISYFANVYTNVLNEGVDWAGEFTLTYLGEFA